MNDSRWERVQALFHATADLPPQEQAAFLVAECDGDHSLRDEVLAMLEHDAREGVLLDGPLDEIAADLFDRTTEPPSAYREIGPYHIQRVLGEGGMGIVFLGVRADLGSPAAIKILRDAWVSPARRERFTLEQRTLAQLDHPNIARLLDADTLADGTPFFVMEYVEGLPLDKYCDSEDCSITERLQLFRSVCEAVQFAHDHAVIHRDLKPSNVLVRKDGVAKLLDFGIAKQRDDMNPAADHTRTGFQLLTPAYASPEQFRGEPPAIHTDIYSLGVILYQLLSRRLPFDTAHCTPAEVAWLLVEHTPASPSQVARRVLERETRGVETVSKSAWADLDVLCLTAMHKDVKKRYGSVQALIRDVDHYLRGEPLEARPDTPGYRLNKFMRRHRRALAASAAVLVSIAALIAFFVIRLASERNAAVAEAARAQRAQHFLWNLLQGGDADAGPANDIRVSALAEQGVQQAKSLNSDPQVQAELYQTLGVIYQQLGNLRRADSLLASALKLRQANPQFKAVDISGSLVAIGLLRMDQARLEEAEKLERQALALAEKNAPPDHPAIASATDALGRVLEEAGAYAKAIPVLEQAVRLRSVPSASPSDLAESLVQLANVYFYAGRYQEAQALNQRVLTMNRQIYGEGHPRVADVLVNLGAIQQQLGYYGKAEQFHRRALAITSAYFGENHYRTASGYTLVARALVFQGRFDEAVQLLRRALAIQERVFGEVHPRVASALNELGTVALQRSRFPEAAADFGRMVEIYRGVYAGKHYLIGIALANLASVYLHSKDYVRAEQLFQEALAMFGQTLPPDHLEIAISRIKLGRVLLRQKRCAEAERETLAGYRILKQQANPSVTWIKNAQADLAEIYAALQRPGKVD